MNQLFIIGNLGRDAEVRHTADGNIAIGFNLAVNKRIPDGKGSTREVVQWYNCTIWKKKGDSVTVADYLLKGTKLMVQGEPTYSIWVNDQKVSTVNVNVRVEKWEFLSKKEDNVGTENGANPVNSPEKKEPVLELTHGGTNDEADNDLPF
jgi:single-strand DNA-binding protein